MRRLLTLVAILCCLLMMLACSETPTTSSGDHASIRLEPRPQFVETRPADVIQSFIMGPENDLVLPKKSMKIPFSPAS